MLDPPATPTPWLQPPPTLPLAAKHTPTPSSTAARRPRRRRLRDALRPLRASPFLRSLRRAAARPNGFAVAHSRRDGGVVDPQRRDLRRRRRTLAQRRSAGAHLHGRHRRRLDPHEGVRPVGRGGNKRAAYRWQHEVHLLGRRQRSRLRRMRPYWRRAHATVTSSSNECGHENDEKNEMKKEN